VGDTQGRADGEHLLHIPAVGTARARHAMESGRSRTLEAVAAAATQMLHPRMHARPEAAAAVFAAAAGVAHDAAAAAGGRLGPSVPVAGHPYRLPWRFPEWAAAGVSEPS
jgi:hypothetical protein